jgi:hypothetical protein
VFSAGSVLATTFRIWLRNLPRFVLIAAICSLPVFGFYLSLRVESIKDFVQRHYYQPIWERHPALINLTGADWIADAMIYGAIAVCVVAQLRGERVGVFRGLGRALRRSVSLLGAGLLHHVVTMGVIGVVIMCIWSRGEWMWRGSTAIYGWAAWSALWVVLRSLLYVVFAIADTCACSSSSCSHRCRRRRSP